MPLQEVLPSLKLLPGSIVCSHVCQDTAPTCIIAPSSTRTLHTYKIVLRFISLGRLQLQLHNKFSREIFFTCASVSHGKCINSFDFWKFREWGWGILSEGLNPTKSDEGGSRESRSWRERGGLAKALPFIIVAFHLGRKVGVVHIWEALKAQSCTRGSHLASCGFSCKT